MCFCNFYLLHGIYPVALIVTAALDDRQFLLFLFKRKKKIKKQPRQLWLVWAPLFSHRLLIRVGPRAVITCHDDLDLGLQV